jgi:hypothetical protein
LCGSLLSSSLSLAYKISEVLLVTASFALSNYSSESGPQRKHMNRAATKFRIMYLNSGGRSFLGLRYARAHHNQGQYKIVRKCRRQFDWLRKQVTAVALSAWSLSC